MSRRASPAVLKRSAAGETFGQRGSPRPALVKVNRSKVVVLDLAMQMSLDMIDRLVHYTLASVLIATRELAVSMLLGMIQMDSGAQLA